MDRYGDPDRHLDDRTADEQLRDRVRETRERFSREGLRELEESAQPEPFSDWDHGLGEVDAL